MHNARPKSLCEFPGCVTIYFTKCRIQVPFMPFVTFRNKDTEANGTSSCGEEAMMQKQNADVCRLSSKSTNPVVEDIVQRLHCHSASGLCLLLGESLPIKKFHFILPLLFKDLQL